MALEERQCKREIDILEQVSHPHIVRTFDLMVDIQNYYIVMELMQGGNLAELTED